MPHSQLASPVKPAETPALSPVQPDPSDPGLSPCPAPNPRELARQLNRFTSPHLTRSIWEAGVTFAPFAALFTALLFAVQAGYYAALLATPLAGLFLLRLFIIQHDCSHGSYFSQKSANNWLGRAISVLTLTPYDSWKRSHTLHHANTGNLDARGFGDVDTLTVREYGALGWKERALYRLYRHPAVLLGLGPAYLFLLRHRWPVGMSNKGGNFWGSVMATNAVSAALLGVIAVVFGPLVMALVFVPVLLTAASLGVWLFYVQHQFEQAYWQYKPGWTFHEAALGGSSYLMLPAPLRWFTGNIGIHHVHHLASRIPFYRLPAVMKAHPELEGVNRLTLPQAVRTMVLALWDEDARRLVSFGEAARAVR